MPQPAQFTRRMIAVPDGEIAVLDFGDPARPVDVLFSHGNGFNALCHAPALSPLSDRLRILAVDQRGHGRTSLPATPEGRENWYDLRDDLLALMDALELDHPVVLAGHSMGSVFSLLASAEVPDRVRAVVALDPVVPPKITPPEEFSPHLLRVIDGTLRRRRVFPDKAAAIAAYTGRGVFATWPADALTAYVEDGFRDADGGIALVCAPEWEVSNYRAQGQPTLEVLLTSRVPVHVLKAAEGSPTSATADNPRVLANPKLRIETIAGTTHCLPMERPDVVQRALLDAVG